MTLDVRLRLDASEAQAGITPKRRDRVYSFVQDRLVRATFNPKRARVFPR